MSKRWNVTVLNLVVAVALAGCAYQVQMMRRDSGKVYTGTGSGNGFGTGSITIAIDGITYSGPMVRTATSDSFGFIQQFGGGAKSAFGSYQTYGGSVTVKALLGSPDGRGLRCDLTGDGWGHGGGVCLDDQSRVYDVIITMD